MAGEEGWDEAGAAGFGEKRLKNTLPLYGNKTSMNINSMILTNILGSPYFKEELINFKTFHEVVDEIFYKVEHLEPWEKNSRKLAGQVGMCAGVRGVAAGGIVSTAFCLLYKLFTLKLTRKQLTAMLNHRDSPYIRGIGFLYIRYCQPPADFWDWFSPYLEDEEEVDLKAGGGYTVPIGEMCRLMISKLDWFGTLFPRLPVTVQRKLEANLNEFKMAARMEQENSDLTNGQEPEASWGEVPGRSQDERRGSLRRSPNNDRRRSRSRERQQRSADRANGTRSREIVHRSRNSSRERRRSRDRSRERRTSRGRSRERRRSRDRSRERRRSRDRSRERRRSRDRSRERRGRSKERRSGDRSKERRRSRDRSKERRRSRDRSRERRRSRDRSREKQRSRDEPSNGTRQRSKDRSRERQRSRSGDRERARKKHRSRSRSGGRRRSRDRSHEKRQQSHSRDRKH